MGTITGTVCSAVLNCEHFFGHVVALGFQVLAVRAIPSVLGFMLALVYPSLLLSGRGSAECSSCDCFCILIG